MRPEDTIETKFVTECAKIGIKSIKLEVKGDKGWPDQMVILPGGRVMFFEFKRPDGKGETSPHQFEKLANLKSYGFICDVVESWEFPLEVVKEYLTVLEQSLTNVKKEPSSIIMPGDPNAKH